MLHNLILLVALTIAPGTEAAAERAHAALDSLLASTSIPAISAAVALSDEVVYAEAMGFAVPADSVTATVSTRFGIGSITKTLTLTLVARLVDRGILDWDTPIQSWLKDFPYPEVTLRHIGAHQSGINDDLTSQLRFTKQHFDTEEAYREIVSAPLDFPPGTRTVYATGSFTVIARLVEKVTGDPFAEVLQREILDPAGMHSTVINDPRVHDPLAASFMDPRDGKLVAVSFDPSIKLAGAGYLSTPTDLVRFGSALLAGRLCSPAQLVELLGEQEDAEGPTGFGLGWRVTEDQGMPAYYQPGGGPGISAYIVLYPERGLAFAIVCNETSGAVGGRAMGTILDTYLGLTTGE